MFLQVNTPVPRDIPLPLPLPEWLLVILLVVSFLLHILFINLMIGGSIVTLWAQIRGLKNKDYDTFAYEVAKTITVNKSLAVVLGVAPLLGLNVLYTVYFYSANALTGYAWIMVIPLVTIAFLLSYLHKYTWQTLEKNKPLHIAIAAAATGVFLIIPFIFLANVNLMMFPEKWPSVQGFLRAVMLPNVLPRYLEFIATCLTATGIFLAWYNSRKRYPVEQIYEKFSRAEVKRISFSIAIVGLSLQLLFGLLVLFTLPAKGQSYTVLFLMGLAGLMLAAALWYSYRSITVESELNLHLGKIIASFLAFVVFYGASRQVYRHNALEKHQELVRARTEEHLRLVKAAKAGLPSESGPASTSAGSESASSEASAPAADPKAVQFAAGIAVFKQYCAACHKPQEKLVGPPITEMASIYAGNTAALKNWIKSPGKKRADMPPMPAFPQLKEEELNELAKYILSFQ